MKYEVFTNTVILRSRAVSKKIANWSLLLLLISLYSFSMKPISYGYTDGNNNDYFITQSRLVYTPVTKEASSSGTYSGGVKKEVKITLEQFQKIESLINAIEEDKGNYIAKREMGCGTVTLINGKLIYVKSSSKNKAVLELELNTLLGK